MDWKEYCVFDHVFVGLQGDMEADMTQSFEGWRVFFVFKKKMNKRFYIENYSCILSFYTF